MSQNHPYNLPNVKVGTHLLHEENSHQIEVHLVKMSLRVHAVEGFTELPHENRVVLRSKFDTAPVSTID
ncbi:hypothetical protein MJO29_016846 [Puccinia striiformis f. sp. tritici]|nr:hypothetical protein MJO29_016846 [Puccinia striiformis f. sp. tritici]